MESQQHHDPHLPRGLRSPFEFVPAQHQHHQHRNPHLHGHAHPHAHPHHVLRHDPSIHHQQDIDTTALDDDPDAFYRPFADRSSLPDIFVQPDYDPFVNHSVPPTMSPRKNGPLASNTSSPRSVGGSSPATRSSLRSNAVAAMAASPSPSPSSSVSKSAPSNANNAKTVRDRVRQLNKPNPALSPGRGKAAAADSRTVKESSTLKPTTFQSPSKRAQNASAQQRQPLFGEVVEPHPGGPDAGFGINPMKHHRSNLHINTQKPTSISSRSRSHSDLNNDPKFSAHSSHSSRQLHPVSDDPPGSPLSPIDYNGKISGNHSRPSSALASRIPVRSRRTSDGGPSSGRLTPRDSPAASRSFGQSPRGRPTTPVTLSSRRYSPKRHVESNQTLTAVVKAPPPKLSPPLKSSRKREPVSTASTAASRARVAERYTRQVSGEQVHQRSAPKNIPAVDVAARRHMVQSKLKSVLPEESRQHRTETRTLKKKRKPSSGQDTQGGALQRDAGHASEQPVAPFQQNLDIQDTDYVLLDRPSLNNLDSPTIEEEMEVIRQRMADPGQASLLRHVLNLRSGSPPASMTAMPEDFMSERGDAETINIVLGDTPRLPSENFRRPDADSPDDIVPNHSDFFSDNRSSLRPDDSVSVVFAQTLAKNKSIPGSEARLRGDFTADNEAWGSSDRVLEQYGGGNTTLEPVKEPRSQANSVSPEINMPGAWDSPPEPEEYFHPDTETVQDEPVETEDSPVSPLPRVSPSPSPSPPTSRAPSRHMSQPRHYLDDLEDDEEVRGTVIIHPPVRSNDTITTVQDNGYPTYSTGRDGLGLNLEVSPTQSRPHSPLPPAPIHSPPPPPSTQNSFTAPNDPNSRDLRLDIASAQIPTPRKGWNTLFSPGLPSSPSPKHRLNRDISEALASPDGITITESRPSKPSLESVSNLPLPQLEASAGSNNATERQRRSSESSPMLVAMEKQLKERWNIIKELVDTEHSYSKDVTIGVDIFMATAPSVPSMSPEDRRILFGNLEQVRSFTAKFLEALKSSVAPVYQIPQENRFHYKRGSVETSRSGNSDHPINAPGAPPNRVDHPHLDRLTTIGCVFNEYMEKMEKIYGDWMKGHEAANKRLEVLRTDENVKLWLNECYENAKDITSAWDLDSLIIKPTQRFMKYPLLLQNLVKCTSFEHPDYEDLKKALDSVITATHKINEQKRSAELVEQAIQKRKKDTESRKKNLAKILHLRPDFLSKQSSNSVATVIQDDNTCDAIVQKFGGHFFQIQIVMRDFEKHCEDVKYYMFRLGKYTQALEENYHFDGYGRHPEFESKIHRYTEVVASIAKYGLPEYMRSVQRFVLEPIRKLWRLHDNPQHLMTKRRKALPTLSRYNNMLEKGEKPSDKLRQEAEQCKAITDVLAHELPRLYSLTRDLVHACLTNFLGIKGQWESIWRKKLEPFIDPSHIQAFFALDSFEFNQIVSTQFYADFDPIQNEIAGMILTSRAMLDELDCTFRMAEPVGGFEDDPSGKRPSTMGSGKQPSLADSRWRSTPTLPNMQTSYRFNDSNNNLLPTPRLGSYSGPSNDLAPPRFGSRSNNNSGPPTPSHTATGATTPNSLLMERTRYLNQQYSEQPDDFVSPDWEDYGISRHAPGMVNDSSRRGSGQNWQPDDTSRFSDIFHSALPADLADEQLDGSGPRLDDEGEPRVLFVAASLFEFNIDSTRREAGYPYLKYVAGEVFDILGQRGELWLARNQDDNEKTLGWIWEKHFALLPNSDNLLDMICT